MGRGVAPSTQCTLNLELAQITLLDDLAESLGVTRSEIARQILDQFEAETRHQGSNR